MSEHHNSDHLQPPVSAAARDFLIHDIEEVDLASLSDDDKQCIICCTDFSTSTPELLLMPVRIKSCSHGGFCAACILRHVATGRPNSNTCPMCRSKLFDRDTAESYFDEDQGLDQYVSLELRERLEQNERDSRQRRQLLSTAHQRLRQMQEILHSGSVSSTTPAEASRSHGDQVFQSFIAAFEDLASDYLALTNGVERIAEIVLTILIDGDYEESEEDLEDDIALDSSESTPIATQHGATPIESALRLMRRSSTDGVAPQQTSPQRQSSVADHTDNPVPGCEDHEEGCCNDSAEQPSRTPSESAPANAADEDVEMTDSPW